MNQDRLSLSPLLKSNKFSLNVKNTEFVTCSFKKQQILNMVLNSN